MRILNYLFKREGSWIFHNPVDPVAWKIEDYFEIVKHPMDFSTIRNKLKRTDPALYYNTVEEFCSDVRLTLENCILYNGVSHISNYRSGVKLVWENRSEAQE